MHGVHCGHAELAGVQCRLRSVFSRRKAARPKRRRREWPLARRPARARMHGRRREEIASSGITPIPSRCAEAMIARKDGKGALMGRIFTCAALVFFSVLAPEQSASSAEHFVV